MNPCFSFTSRYWGRSYILSLRWIPADLARLTPPVVGPKDSVRTGHEWEVRNPLIYSSNEVHRTNPISDRRFCFWEFIHPDVVLLLTKKREYVGRSVHNTETRSFSTLRSETGEVTRRSRSPDWGRSARFYWGVVLSTTQVYVGLCLWICYRGPGPGESRAEGVGDLLLEEAWESVREGGTNVLPNPSREEVHKSRNTGGRGDILSLRSGHDGESLDVVRVTTLSSWTSDSDNLRGGVGWGRWYTDSHSLPTQGSLLRDMTNWSSSYLLTFNQIFLLSIKKRVNIQEDLRY